MGINGEKQYLQKAVRYLMKAHHLGDPYAFFLLQITGLSPEYLSIKQNDTTNLLSDVKDNKYIEPIDYLEGYFVEKNEEKAFELFQRQNNEYEIARCYQYGIGTKENIEKALTIYRELDMKGNDDAMCQIGIIDYHQGNISDAKFKFIQARQSGNPRGSFLLSLLIEDLDQRHTLLEEAVNYGIIDASFLLALEEDEFKDISLFLEKRYIPIYFTKAFDSKYLSYSMKRIDNDFYLIMFANTQVKNDCFQGIGPIFPPFIEEKIFSCNFRSDHYYKFQTIDIKEPVPDYNSELPWWKEQTITNSTLNVLAYMGNPHLLCLNAFLQFRYCKNFHFFFRDILIASSKNVLQHYYNFHICLQ